MNWLEDMPSCLLFITESERPLTKIGDSESRTFGLPSLLGYWDIERVYDESFPSYVILDVIR